MANSWTIGIMDGAKSTISFRVVEVFEWASYCVALPIMESGLVDGVRTSREELREITCDVLNHLPKSYGRSLKVSSRLLAALEKGSLDRINDTYVLDCVRNVICDCVLVVGRLPKIVCVGTDPNVFGLKLVLEWGKNISAKRRRDVKRALSGSVVDALTTRDITFAVR
ncbi:hypothetical protein K435DRAFT_802542 [Dendrothele bispora CBS 962.96]|uniref:Uncharacterized protein n=1 Tax=Dendrothele bispora (strain CBS 962.96) TaxID=1314807 RepID=A0A4S8LKE9_DENBC|nr:hypothetical protein K435DRAFT_802542 [Dendrothele bispora CBS 962.96]